MFKYLKKLLNYYSKKQEQHDPKDSYNSLPLYTDLQINIKIIKEIFGQSPDVIFREFKIGQREAALVFIEGLTNVQLINENVLEPLMNWQKTAPITLGKIRDHLLTISQLKDVDNQDKLIEGLLSGGTALLLEDHAGALILDTRGFETRSIQEPATEVVVRGPKEGFTEKIQVNISLIRRKLKTTNFVVEKMSLGVQSNTLICLVYLKGIVQETLVQEIKKRLSKIKLDAVLESGYIEQMIEDAPHSPFPTIANTEKPDIVAAKLLEGRAAILVDGTPFVLTVPKLFIESFQSAEDYYSRPYYATIIRILRYLAFFITTIGPAIYVALTTFHQEMIPTPLLYTMAAARERIPFPSVVAALLMGMVYEYFRESGIRLPRPIGSSISIIGGLVIGDMAVNAGLVSAPLLIVIALTAITSFVVSSLADAATILRLFFTIMAGFMGFVGVFFVFIAALIHLCSLMSFGTAYLTPLTPFRPQGAMDSLVRFPLKSMVNRPAGITKDNQRRRNFSYNDKKDDK